MIRTRDFLLFLLSAGFLVLAIVITAAKSPTFSSAYSFAPAGPLEDREYSVEISDPDTIDRQSRIMALREHIASMNDETISAPVVEEAMVDNTDAVEQDETRASSTVKSDQIQLCDSYSVTSVWWPANEIKTAERDGVRVVYIETPASPSPNEVSSSSVDVPAVNEQILVELPTRSTPVTGTRCLSSDIVGVAIDGSLIRNRDHTAYSVFESFTLIGYALDGFPIYGNAPEIETDECGGAMVGTTYRYYISPEREGMIGCFSGIPVRI